MSVDLWGEPLAADDSSSIDSWNMAWTDAMHFVGDSFETLAHANAHDSEFALGSVFCGVYRILGGARFDMPELRSDIARARDRASDPRELAHVAALETLASGNFTTAAKAWDAHARDTHDFAAVRFAHDIYLHVGDAPRRLRSSQQAIDMWSEDEPWWSFIAGQHAFSLEETGFLDEAETLAHRALDLDPMDLWALHALAHIYETREDSATSIELLRSRQDVWAAQDQLSVHIWWHLALRLIADGAFDEALDIHDALTPVATTPFRICDLVSLLWRLELDGVDVGERWDGLAEAFGARPEIHTSGFLDLHAAMVFTRQPGHPSAGRFFESVVDEHPGGASENSQNFRQIVRPMVEAIRMSDDDPLSSAESLARLDHHLHRIGGSIAQRDIVALTQRSLESTPLEIT